MRHRLRLFLRILSPVRRVGAAVGQLLRLVVARVLGAIASVARGVAGLFSPRTWTALIGLCLIGVGLAQLSPAAGLAVPGVLLFLLAAPAYTLVWRPGGKS